MNARERILILVLGVALVGGLGYGVYALVVAPFLDARQKKEDLEGQVALKQDELRKVQLKNKRLNDLYKRSLPAEETFATLEYEAALTRLLRESKLKAVNYSVSSHTVDAKNIPKLTDTPNVRDAKPAYKKVGFQIRLTNVTLTQLTTFLSKYYELNLLQHLNKFEIKRADSTSLGDDRRPVDERNDLNVTLVTEAIILDGAPARRTLVAVPTAHGGVLGGAGLAALENNPEQGRGITPQQIDQLLASPGRDYTLLAARDIYHGKLPEPPPPKTPEKVVIPPKPDFSDYIKLMWVNRTSDPASGEVSAEVLIYDVANNQDYKVIFTQYGEKLSSQVEKWYYKSAADGGGKRREYKEFVLDISNASMRTKRKFNVYGLDGNALIVGEMETAADKTDKGSKEAAKPAEGVKPTDPPAATAPAPAAEPKGERFYRWEEGQSLSKIKELAKADAEKAIQRAKTSLLDPIPTAAPPPAEKVTSK